jgi:general secretion pathway protein D
MRSMRKIPVVLPVLVWAALGWPIASIAQPSPPLGPALVTAVTASEISPLEAGLTLAFNQAPPQYSVISNDSSTAVIVFIGSKLAPGAPAVGGKAGPIQSMAFAQADSVLTLRLSAAGPVHVVATPGGGRTLVLAITGRSAQRPGSDSAPTRLVAHEDPSEPDQVFEVVPLKYADVSEIVGLLTATQTVKPNDNFTPQEPAFGSAGMQYSGGPPGGGLPAQSFNAGLAGAQATDSLGQSVDDAVGVDRRLNAIILRGSAARVARLKAHILKLDVPVSSVVLETVFVELTESGARDIGLDLSNASHQVASVGYQYARGGKADATPSTSRGGAINVSLQAAVYAQIAKGQGRIISRPRIAAQSGSTAKIVTGDALPITTSIALSGVNAVSQQVQYVTVGVTLQIAPRVTVDGFVTSHIFAEVSSVTGYSQGYPTISQREASTSATVRDGESFIIGGLTQDSELSQHSKTPFAGDIPGLGRLFGLETSSRTKTDLYVVVTPHIVGANGAVATAVAETK